LSRMVITAPATRASWVQIYEPRQTPDQEEVILEEFAIDGGETEFRDPRSATAAFRFLPLTEQQRQALEDARNERLARDGDEDAALALTRASPASSCPRLRTRWLQAPAVRPRSPTPRTSRAARAQSARLGRRRPLRHCQEEVQRGEEERAVPRRAPEQSKRTAEEPKKRGPKPGSKRK
jgi:hypothetical protein